MEERSLDARVRVGSLGERLADVLRERIIRGELESGTRLVEGTLAQQFDVSRGPVRDALSILVSQGLVATRRQGVVVKGLSRDDIEELYSLRMAVEDLALRLAIDKNSGVPGAWDVAGAEAEALLRCARTGELGTYAEHDLAFHTEFYRLSRHSRLNQVWDQYRPIFSVILKVTNELDAPDLQPSAMDHQKLLDLILAGDVATAREVLEVHLMGSLNRIRTAVARRQTE